MNGVNMTEDPTRGLVAGERLSTSIEQFVTEAAVLIEKEQNKSNPDAVLIEFFCDAVRLAREHVNCMQSYWKNYKEKIREDLFGKY